MIKNSLRRKLVALVMIAMLPVLVLNVIILGRMYRFQEAYDSIISNMTIANTYNLNFKEEMDECIYKLVFNGETFSKMEEDNLQLIRNPDRRNPYVLIYELREAFARLEGIADDGESKTWLGNLLRCIDTLEDRVDDIQDNLYEGGHYSENVEMLDNNIYILTDLINDDIQHYLYYQTRSMEQVRDALSEQMRSFLSWSVLSLLLLLIVLTAFTLMLLRNITRPLGELTRVAGRIAEGNFTVRSGVYSEDEIGQVAGAVNDMAEHLEIMVEQIKEDEHKMRSAELRLLQEQINPHFLYNTLDAIVWLIEGGRYEEAEDMVMSLSDFFKLALSHGRETITIREEELHIRSYLQIQQVRYRDILDYSLEIDPKIYAYGILKLTLQPLVENAIYHGIKPKRAKGRLTITGHLDEEHRIILTVADDGVGMSDEELETLRREISMPCADESSKGFGMANVSERIRLYYGKEYGLSIDSKTGEGTRVTVLLPARWIGEQEKEYPDWT